MAAPSGPHIRDQVGARIKAKKRKTAHYARARILSVIVGWVEARTFWPFCYLLEKADSDLSSRYKTELLALPSQSTAFYSLA